MQNLFQIIINYLWTFLKLIGLSFLVSIPFFILIKLFEKKYATLRKKKSVIFSLSIIIFILSYLLLLLIYFLPIISTIFKMQFIDATLTILYHLIRLLIINFLITGIILSFSFVTLGLLDYFSKNKKSNKNFNLIKSLTITNIVFFIILLIFPKLFAILIYLIYL